MHNGSATTTSTASWIFLEISRDKYDDISLMKNCKVTDLQLSLNGDQVLKSINALGQVNCAVVLTVNNT